MIKRIINAVIGLAFFAGGGLTSQEGQAQSSEAAGTIARETQTLERTLRQQEEAEKLERFQQMEQFQLPLIDMGDLEAKIPAAGEGMQIILNGVRISESKILTNEELETITAKYIGRAVYISDLYEMVAKINRLYRDKKFITARAVLPPQTLKDGILEIQLIEGVVGRLIIQGNEYTSESFISNRMQLQSGDLVELGALEESLIRFNKLYRTQLAVELKAGENFEETDLIIIANEPERVVVNAYVDNLGTTSTGKTRMGAIISSPSLFGFEDSFSMGITRSQGRAEEQGSRSGFINYAPYINTYGTKLDLTYTSSDSTIIDGPLKSLNIHGKSKQYGAGLEHPLLVEAEDVVKVTLDSHYSSSSSKFTGVEEYTRIKKVSSGVDWEHLGDGSYLTFDFQGHYMWTNVKGTTGWDRENYRKLTTSIFYYTKVNDELNFQFTANGQYVPMEDSIIPAEQYLLGGRYSVRAYEESQFSGNDGYYMGFEFQVPYVWEHGWTSYKDRPTSGNFYMFYDHGAAFPERGDDEKSRQSKDYANAAGFGFRMNQFLGALNLDTFVAFGLDKEHGDEQKSPKLQVSLSASF